MNIPLPICTRCSRRVRLVDCRLAEDRSGDLVCVAHCHGAAEATTIPLALRAEIAAGKARLLPGEAFKA